MTINNLTQIEIDCTVTLKALGYEVLESSLDHIHKKIYFKTNKPITEQASNRIKQRVMLQQSETYSVHFDTLEINQEPKGEK